MHTPNHTLEIYSIPQCHLSTLDDFSIWPVCQARLLRIGWGLEFIPTVCGLAHTAQNVGEHNRGAKRANLDYMWTLQLA